MEQLSHPVPYVTSRIVNSPHSLGQDELLLEEWHSEIWPHIAIFTSKPFIHRVIVFSSVDPPDDRELLLLKGALWLESVWSSLAGLIYWMHNVSL